MVLASPGPLLTPQDLDVPLRLAAQRKINGYRQQSEHFLFSPRHLSTSTRMLGEFLSLLLLQANWRVSGDRGALHCRWNDIATQPIKLVKFQS